MFCRGACSQVSTIHDAWPAAVYASDVTSSIDAVEPARTGSCLASDLRIQSISDIYLFSDGKHTANVIQSLTRTFTHIKSIQAETLQNSLRTI